MWRASHRAQADPCGIAVARRDARRDEPYALGAIDRARIVHRTVAPTERNVDGIGDLSIDRCETLHESFGRSGVRNATRLRDRLARLARLVELQLVRIFVVPLEPTRFAEEAQ